MDCGNIRYTRTRTEEGEVLMQWRVMFKNMGGPEPVEGFLQLKDATDAARFLEFGDACEKVIEAIANKARADIESIRAELRRLRAAEECARLNEESAQVELRALRDGE